MQGCIFFKNMSYWLVGELKKYDDLLRKNANIWGKRWKKGGKEEKLHCTWVKNIILEKKGGGCKIINYFDNIHHCQDVFRI